MRNGESQATQPDHPKVHFSNHIRKVVANIVITKKYRYLNFHSEKNTLKWDKNIDRRIMCQQDYTELCRVQTYCSGEVHRALL